MSGECNELVLHLFGVAPLGHVAYHAQGAEGSSAEQRIEADFQLEHASIMVSSQDIQAGSHDASVWMRHVLRKQRVV